MERPLRVVVAESGADARRRQVELTRRELRDAGCEVIQLGPSRASAVAEAALQEDVDAVVAPAADATWSAEARAELEARGMGHVRVLGADAFAEPAGTTPSPTVEDLVDGLRRAAATPEPTS